MTRAQHASGRDDGRHADGRGFREYDVAARTEE
jgi:hypothetical protein